MKKILSLVLSASLVLGSFGMAFAAPADVEGTKYEDAVTRLAALEVLGGYSDGTFKPEKTITRAEFAKIMANVTGVGAAAEYASGQTKFADVAADHWAAGYINVVSDMGIINGYGDGNFGPQDQVTYAQAITMIVRALGYTPKADAMGGYPGGYLAVAAEKEITDDVNVVASLAATRGDVSMMVNNSLTVDLMEQITYGQYPEYAENDEKNLMKTKLNVDEVTGIVTAVPNTDSVLDADEIRIDGDKYDFLVEGANFDTLLGLEVTVWEDGGDILDFDIETDEDEIFFDTVVKSTEADGIEIYVEDDTFEWADKAKAYVNFEEEKDLDKIPADTYGYIVLNEKEEVTYANLFKFGEVPVGSVYEVDGDVYKYVEPSKNTQELELSDYDDGVFIYNEKMELVDTDAIDVNSAIFAWETSDELYLIVKNEAVEGTLERIKAKEVKVDDTSYDASGLGAVYSDDAFDNFDVYDDVDDLDNLGDEAVVAVLDLNGELLFIHGDADTTSSTMYGLVTYGEVGSKAEATVFTKEDEEVDYKFETRSEGSVLDGKKYFDTVEALKTLEFAAMKYKLNKDGEIADGESTIYEIAYAGTTLPTQSDKGDAVLIGDLTKNADKNYVTVAYGDGNVKYYISEDTVFMTALDAKDLDPDVVAYEDIYESAISANNEVFVIGTEGKDADMIVFLNSAFSGADDDVYYGIVTDSPWKDGSDYVAKIDVFDKGEDEYVVANKADFTEGKIVAFKYNTDKEIEFVAEAPGSKADYENVIGADLGDFDYDDGYVDLDGTEEKVESGIVFYSLDVYTKDDGTLDTSKGVNGVKGIDEKDKITNIDDFNNVYYVLNDDDIAVAAVAYKLEAATPTSGWELALTDEADTAAEGINVAITKPASVADFTAHSVALYDGTTLVTIKAAAADVDFSTTDGLVKGKIYTVKVLKTDDLSVVVEKNIANIN